MNTDEKIEHLGLPNAFPEFFPTRLELYRRSLSEATDAPDEYGVAYMLGAGATAAGANVSACVQNGWCVRANLFLAIIGHKGSGKSTLANKVFEPLLRHEEDLRNDQAATDDDEEVEDEGESDRTSSRKAKPSEPCVIINDCTGPAVLRLLEHNERQLLVNPDEMSALFIRNTGGTDRQMWCELYDGRRRRQHRASPGGSSMTLAEPYVSMLGGIQPDLLKCLYGKRGDDGFLDRVLLVGVPRMPAPAWPRDADDPGLNAAWAETVSRLLYIESLAADRINGQVECRLTDEAREILQATFQKLNALVVAIGIPESQRGIVKKLVQHAVKLALLHRCFRWAAGEFGVDGPVGDIDSLDAKAACQAMLFFFGRWLTWRPELTAGPINVGATTGLSSGNEADPALRWLAATAARNDDGIRLIDQLIRHLRGRDSKPVLIASLAAATSIGNVSVDEIIAACDLLVSHGHAQWSAGKEAIRIAPLPEQRSVSTSHGRPMVATS